MHADGGIGASAGDNVHPPPAPSPLASKCPQVVLYLVTSTGCKGFPKGEQRRCISDGTLWRCENGRKRSRCKECGGSSICEHRRQRHQCKECGGASVCEHGRERSKCKECGGAGICEHGRVRSQCKECGGGGICEHGGRRSECKECGGASVCEHGRKRYRCKECGGAGICEHGGRRSQCKECGGASICEHRRRRSHCKECGGVSLCNGCKATVPSFGMSGEARWCKRCTMLGGHHAGRIQAFNKRSATRQRRRSDHSAHVGASSSLVDLTAANATDGLGPPASSMLAPAIKQELDTILEPANSPSRPSPAKRRRIEKDRDDSSDMDVVEVASQRSKTFARAWTPTELSDRVLRRLNCPGNPSHGVRFPRILPCR